MKNSVVGIETKEVLFNNVPGEVVNLRAGGKRYIPPVNGKLTYIGRTKTEVYDYCGKGMLRKKFYHLQMADGKEFFFRLSNGVSLSVINRDEIPSHFFENEGILMKLRMCLGF